MARSVASSGLVAVRTARGAGQDVEAEVAALLGPLVVLLGQDGADQADDGVPVGEDADDVGAAADLRLSRSLRVVRTSRHISRGKTVNAGRSARAAVEVVGDGREACPCRRRGSGRTGR